MEYTVSKEANKKVEQDVKIIQEIILKKIKPAAIVMFGGFGHGGGSFRKIGNKIIPLNDYDMYIITKNKIDSKISSELEVECAKAIGRGGKEIVKNFNEKYDLNQFFHVDLHFMEFKKLRKMYPTQRTFDLKNSLVVYGDKKVLENIPNLKISKSDAIRMLFNKIDHFSIAEGNSEIIKSIYAVKGFTDLCTSLLIFSNKYTSKYQDREKVFRTLNVPNELKDLVSKATKAKLYGGYKVKDVDDFFNASKKLVKWTLKKILQKYLGTTSEDWKEICKIAYKKLPYTYFDDYLGNPYLFLGQYYLNICFFLEGLKEREYSIKPLLRWRDSGLIIALSMILYFTNEKKEAEKYLKKLTGKIYPLKDRIMKLYSIYYLQKLI
ncbi:Uncharacterised protein [uncultured archaeon]|nr:Uncharacterised protein [uncultured archaeon]